jgi:sugar/nucleoside kinase (ribokinase family)
MQPIAVAGHLCVDLNPQLPQDVGLRPGQLIEIGPLRMSLGGAVGNTGRELHRLGVPVRLSAVVGEDALATYVRHTLEDLGQAVDGVVAISGQGTSYSFVLEPPGVDRTFWHSVGANAVFDGASVDVTGIDILTIGYPSVLPALLVHDGAPLSSLLTRARQVGVTTSLDLCFVDRNAPAGHLDWVSLLERWLPDTDLFSPSVDDLLSAFGRDDDMGDALIEELLDFGLNSGVAVMAMSAGEYGLYVRTASRDRLRQAGRGLSAVADEWADRSFHIPALWHQEPVTTKGAGDASTAGLLFGIVQGLSAEHAARWASACAAVVVSGGELSRDAVAAFVPDLPLP